MSRAGFAIRQARAHERVAAAPCEHCTHPVGQHRELGYTSAVVDGELVDQPRPGHAAGVFHCTVEGCTCALDLRAEARR